MTSSTIIEVVEKLVGSIKPVGETYEDMEVETNILTLSNVVNHLICDMINNNDTKSSSGSIEDCRQLVIEQVKNINSMINEYLEDMKSIDEELY